MSATVKASAKPDTSDLIRDRKRYLMPCYGSYYEEPLLIERATMQYVYDGDDRRYLDCFSGVGVVNCGHCNAGVAEAVSRAVRELDHTTTIYLTRPMIEVARRLSEFAPGGLTRTFFCSTGSEANDGAAVLATLATGRHNFLSFDRSLHGRTLLTMNLTGLDMWRTDPSLSGRVCHLPTPDCSRCPFGLAVTSCKLECARAAARTIESEPPDTFAAMFVEPILGNGGIVPLPDGYLDVLRPTLDMHGILLIADEMQTGFGRTGRRFGIEHYGHSPDIMTVAKALGNGIPVGAMIATEEVASFYTRPGASTFGGNGASMAAAGAVLTLMTKQNLPARACELGTYLADGLRELASRFDCIHDVRGFGLMLGAEIADAGGSPDPARTDRIMEGMRREGVLIGKTGPSRNVLTFMPPLVVERHDLDKLLDALETTLESGDAR